MEVKEKGTRKRVGVLRGGDGNHYKTSLKRGGEIISHLLENLSDKYKPVDILIDKEGIWHMNGVPVVVGDLSQKIDIGWNAAHPTFSNILNSVSIPHVGVDSFSHTLGNSRDMLRRHMGQIGVGMPRHIVIPVYQRDFDGLRERFAIKKAKEVHERFGAPWIVKSFTPDSNMGIHVAKTFNELVGAIEDGVKHEKSILVEEFIEGKVAAVHAVTNFRGEDIYTFPLGDTFGIFSSEEKDKLASLARGIYVHLGARHYLKLNFLLSSRGKVYLTDFETSPDLRSDSHFSQVVESVGAKMHQVVEHILEEVIQ